MWNLSMPKKKPYFPNNWKQYKAAPAEWFEPLTFDELMDWKLCGWELPSSVVCMIRETNTITGKVTEHVYQRESAAKNKCRGIMAKGESEFIVCTPTEIHHMWPEELEDYDDPLA